MRNNSNTPSHASLAILCYAHVDDALSTEAKPITGDTRLVAFQCGFEPLVVAVHSCLPDTKVDADDACELAEELLTELGWLEGQREADYVI